MRKKIFKILVTGGAGFIGSEFVRQSIKRGYKVIVADKLTYAGDLERLRGIEGRYNFYRRDICAKKQMDAIFRKEAIDAVVHFAAATHVDRSILDASPFIETNIKGTQILLDASRKNMIKKFVHISTDEVYGEIEKGKFSENSSLKPNSPYAASKAAADLLVKSYMRTYGFPAIIIRPGNNYGPWQYPEKLIPLAIARALKNQKVPLYARGENVREWFFVKDCAEAILLLLEKGRLGETYNIGSGQERRNIDAIKELLKILGKPENLIDFVKDRPGHDLRYALNTTKLKDELGWQARTKFEDGLKNTVDWYMNNKAWLDKHYSEKLSIKF